MSPVKHTVCTLFIGLFLWLGMTQCNRKQAVTCTPRPHDDTITVVFTNTIQKGFDAVLWDVKEDTTKYTILIHFPTENVLAQLFGEIIPNNVSYPFDDVIGVIFYFNRRVENDLLRLAEQDILGYSMIRISDKKLLHELIIKEGGAYSSVEGYTLPLPFVSFNTPHHILFNVFLTPKTENLGYLIINNTDNHNEQGEIIRDFDNKVPFQYNSF